MDTDKSKKQIQLLQLFYLLTLTLGVALLVELNQEIAAIMVAIVGSFSAYFASKNSNP
jgi:hypothetical protein